MISSQTRQTRLVVFGVALHALLIYAMFDVHFLTPLVHDIEPTIADFAAPASRLVIIVADGLRGDRLFEMEDASDPDTTPRTPRARGVRGGCAENLAIWHQPRAASHGVATRTRRASGWLLRGPERHHERMAGQRGGV